jgi:serine/threonine-protein kinase
LYGISDLTSDFKNHYSITGFFKGEKKGGQKSVHFVIRDNKNQVLKIFPGGADERFKREMKIHEEFKDCDGIPKIFEVDEYHGETLLFEEFIEGEALEDIVSSYKGQNDKIKALISDLFVIMSPVWVKNFVHRDIKPANIIIRPNSKPVVLDFGIARDLSDSSITGTGGLQPGTWKWAAPEQYYGLKEMISYRTDFFSLGVLVFYLYHNVLPFGKSPEDIDAKFKSGDESFPIAEACCLKEFLKETMRFRVAERPRNIDDLYKLIN